MEDEPKDPRIAGRPASMAVVVNSPDNRMYTGTIAGKKIHYYTNTGWKTAISIPQGSLGDLAAIDEDLYVLVFPGSDPSKSTALKKYDGVKWEDIDTSELSDDGYRIQNLFSAGGKIYAGAMKSSSSSTTYAILCYDPGDPPDTPSATTVKKDLSSLLKGVAEATDGIYLAMSRAGVYKISLSLNDMVYVPDVSGDLPDASGKGSYGNIIGIIETGGIIVAVSNDGKIYQIDGGVMSEPITAAGSNFTGAMCVWRSYESGYTDSNPVYNNWKPTLLLLGTRSKNDSQNFGYLEMILAAGGAPTEELKTPGEEDKPTSAPMKRAKYQASIAKHPIESFAQPVELFSSDPDVEYVPLFAATAQSGLWVCKNGAWTAQE